MGIFKLEKNKEKVKNLIKDWEEVMLWGCIDGEMGEIYVDEIENPKSAQFVIGDFCFFAGIPNVELVENIRSIKKNFSIMIGKDSEWNNIICRYPFKQCKERKRYAIKKEKGVLDKIKLKEIVESLEAKYELRRIDEDLYKKVMKEEWSRDLCDNFLDEGDYLKRGIGFVILSGEEVISGASSYMGYKKAIEIEIDTKENYRRKGLALVVGAKLVLECLNNGIYPSWDAANLGSVALAEKLGYHFSHEYIAYEVMW